MVRREAVRPVDRDRDPDAGLVKRQRIEDGLGEDDLLARFRRLEVHDAPERTRQVAVASRLHPAAVEARPLACQRIRERHDDAAAQQLSALGRDDARRQELVAQLARPRDRLEERAVGVADPERPHEVGVRDPSLDEVGLSVLPLAEGLVVMLDDASEDLASLRPRRRAMEGRALGRGLRLAGARRRQRLDRSSPGRPRTLLHEPLELEARTPRERLERTPEAHLVVLRHKADDVARGPAAEAVVEPLRRRDVEARRLLLVKRTGRHELPALPPQLDPALSDDRREVVRGLDPRDPFLRDLHPTPSPLAAAPRRPRPSGGGLPT